MAENSCQEGVWIAGVRACPPRMHMPESDAAQIAVRIGNILKQAGKPEYWDMAYFDQGSGGV